VTAVAMTEPDAGSDLAAMATTAVESGGEVVLNGVKTFISNGVLCDLVVVAARDPEVTDRHRSVSLYLVEDGTPGFKKGAPLAKLGVRSQDTAELFFSNCRIPVQNRLGEKGSGFAKLMQKLQQERLLVALLGICKARYILDWTLDYCKTHTAGDRRLSRQQATQFSLAEMETDVRLGRVFVDTLIRDHMHKRDVGLETSMAKYWTTDLANRVATRCLDLCGAEGMKESTPIVRTFRDVRVTPIFAGTNEIMKTIIAKHLQL
jgi:alkylation response protein AidB-like acyl-CoA dehydrogenase